MNAIKVVSKVPFEIQVWDGIKWPASFDVGECISPGSLMPVSARSLKSATERRWPDWLFDL